MSEEQQSKTRVKVDIMGKEYRFISGEHTPIEYIHKVAGYVDSQMRKINKHQPSLDTPRLAVLAAVNIADEYFKVRTEQDRKTGSAEDRIQGLEEKQSDYERTIAHMEREKKELLQKLEKQQVKEQELLDELVAVKEQHAQTKKDANSEDEWKEDYRKLQDEYRKLQTEFNDWLNMVEQDRRDH